MSSPAKPLTYLAFALMVLAGLLGGIFAAGYAFADLDTPQAIGSTAPWLVLAILLSVFAYVSRRIAPWALAALTAFTVVRTPIESALAQVEGDGPFEAIWLLVLGVALAFLGLHHPRWAGALLAALAAGQVVALLVRPDSDEAGLGSLLGSSSGVVVVPLLVVAVLFLAAGVVRHPREPVSRT